jgi:hypothetical protein
VTGRIRGRVEDLLDGHVDELDIAHPGTRRLDGLDQ